MALAGGLGMVAVGAWQHWSGHRAGVAEATEERNAHWEAQLRVLVAEHAKQLAAETAKAKSIEDAWLTQTLKVGEALAKERETNARLRGDLAAAVARTDRMRNQLAAVATGGRTEAEDTVAACRARADALGVVLETALRAHRVCELDAEDLASGLRAMQAAWPRDEVASP